MKINPKGRYPITLALIILPHISQCGLGPENLVTDDIIRQNDPTLTLCNETLTECITGPL